MGGIITFGKRHRGERLVQVILRDPDWFFWAIEENAFDRDPGLLPEAQVLAYKAMNIRIPKPNPQDWCIRYVIDRRGRFERFDIVEVMSKDWDNASQMVLSDRLDLSFPRQLKQYDKLGCALLLKSFKHHFLGSKDARLTREWCEAFFSDNDNFVERRKSAPSCYSLTGSVQEVCNVLRLVDHVWEGKACLTCTAG